MFSFATKKDSVAPEETETKPTMPKTLELRRSAADIKKLAALRTQKSDKDAIDRIIHVTNSIATNLFNLVTNTTNAMYEHCQFERVVIKMLEKGQRACMPGYITYDTKELAIADGTQKETFVLEYSKGRYEINTRKILLREYPVIPDLDFKTTKLGMFVEHVYEQGFEFIVNEDSVLIRVIDDVKGKGPAEDDESDSSSSA